MNEYYFPYKGDLPKSLKTRPDKYSKVKSSVGSILYKTNNWDDSLSTILGNPRRPKYSAGKQFNIDGNIENIVSIEPVFVSNDWTFKYLFNNGKYRLEDQL